MHDITATHKRRPCLNTTALQQPLAELWVAAQGLAFQAVMNPVTLWHLLSTNVTTHLTEYWSLLVVSKCVSTVLTKFCVLDPIVYRCFKASDHRLYKFLSKDRLKFVSSTLCPKKRPPFIFLTLSKINNFNDFCCVKSWENLTSIACTFAHLTCIL